MAKAGGASPNPKKIQTLGKKSAGSRREAMAKIRGVPVKDLIREEVTVPKKKLVGILPDDVVMGSFSTGKATASKAAAKFIRDTEGFSIKSLNIQSRNPLEMAEKVSKGLETSRVNFLAISSGMTADEIAATIDIKLRTWARRKAEGLLNKEESERLVRIGMLVDQAKQVFEGDVEATQRWLNQPSRALGGKPPLEVASTELGASEVRDLLVRLEHGVPS